MNYFAWYIYMRHEFIHKGIHLDLDTWIVPGQILKTNLRRGLGNSYKPASTEVLILARRRRMSQLWTPAAIWDMLIVNSQNMHWCHWVMESERLYLWTGPWTPIHGPWTMDPPPPSSTLDLKALNLKPWTMDHGPSPALLNPAPQALNLKLWTMDPPPPSLSLDLGPWAPTPAPPPDIHPWWPQEQQLHHPVPHHLGRHPGPLGPDVLLDNGHHLQRQHYPGTVQVSDFLVAIL